MGMGTGTQRDADEWLWLYVLAKGGRITAGAAIRDGVAAGFTAHKIRAARANIGLDTSRAPHGGVAIWAIRRRARRGYRGGESEA